MAATIANCIPQLKTQKPGYQNPAYTACCTYAFNYLTAIGGGFTLGTLISEAAVMLGKHSTNSSHQWPQIDALGGPFS